LEGEDYQERQTMTGEEEASGWEKLIFPAQ